MELSLEFCNKALLCDDKNGKAYYNRANAYMALSLNEKALEDFDSAIELQNGNCKFYHGKGLAYQEMGDY